MELLLKHGAHKEHQTMVIGKCSVKVTLAESGRLWCGLCYMLGFSSADLKSFGDAGAKGFYCTPDVT